MRFNNISLQSFSFTDNTPIEEPVTDPRLKYKRFSVWQNNENFQIPQNSEIPVQPTEFSQKYLLFLTFFQRNR